MSFLLSKELNSRVEHTDIYDPRALAAFKKGARCDYPFTIDDMNEHLKCFHLALRQLFGINL